MSALSSARARAARARQLRRQPEAGELARQQDEHHAQLAHHRQQQAPEALGAAVVVAVQVPDLLGLALAVDQGREAGGRCRVRGRVVVDRGRERVGVGAELVQQREGLDQDRRGLGRVRGGGLEGGAQRRRVGALGRPPRAPLGQVERGGLRGFMAPIVAGYNARFRAQLAHRERRTCV
jgi:hypothetical protein